MLTVSDLIRLESLAASGLVMRHDGCQQRGAVSVSEPAKVSAEPKAVAVINLDALDHDPWLDAPWTPEELATLERAEAEDAVPWE